MAEVKSYADLNNALLGFGFTALYEEICYKGFNANIVAEEAVAKLGVGGTISIAMLGTLRGTNTVKLAPLRIVTKDGTKTIGELVKSRVLLEKKTGSSPKELSIGRIAAACAQHAAYGLMVAKISSRIPDCALPAYCQFPGLLALGFDMTNPHTAAEVNKVLDFFSRAFGTARRPELESAINAGALMNNYKAKGLSDMYQDIINKGFAMKPRPME